MKQSRTGGQVVPRKPRAAKKPYNSPALVVHDANAAKAKLKAEGDPKDPIVQKMLSFVDSELNRRKVKPHADGHR
jgi:hypothetical protein